MADDPYRYLLALLDISGTMTSTSHGVASCYLVCFSRRFSYACYRYILCFLYFGKSTKLDSSWDDIPKMKVVLSSDSEQRLIVSDFWIASDDIRPQYLSSYRRILKSLHFALWIIIDLDKAGLRVSLLPCLIYI